MTTTMDIPIPHRWQDEFFTSAVVVAVIGFATAALKGAGHYLPKVIRMKEEVDIVGAITDQHPIYREMENAVEVDGAQRVLMLSMHNGGQLPHMTSPLFVSSVHSTADTIKHRHNADYQNVTVDSHYMQMLIQMHSSGEFLFDMVDQEKKNSLLWRFYRSEGVTDSFLVYLTTNKRKLIYMSFSLYGGKFTDDQLTRFRLRASNVKNMLNK